VLLEREACEVTNVDDIQVKAFSTFMLNKKANVHTPFFSFLLLSLSLSLSLSLPPSELYE